ncbi:MAG: radical SAM protein [Ignavibacteriales bacterium]
MKISIGTEGVLGIKKIKMDAAPTTAYLMLGTKCSNNCIFCPQARASKSGENLLSRVSWNNATVNVWPLIDKAYKKNMIKRACIQVISQPGISELLAKELAKYKSISKVPLCISGGVNSIEDIDKLIELGVDRIGIALDAATPEIYRRVKGLDFLRKLYLLQKAAAKYPGRISTHLISGLGEKEDEMLEMIQVMYEKGINVALFAFTPIQGTLMEYEQPPEISTYRRIQIGHYLIKEKICQKEDIIFENGEVKELPMKIAELMETAKGIPFMTTGCSGCNRPYYNEKPGGIMYNYPRELTEEEIHKAYKESELLLD